jgi:hypothetical protein
MIKFRTERSNKRDHWPPGFHHPEISGVRDRSISLPSDLVRYFLKDRQVGDPQIPSIL